MFQTKFVEKIKTRTLSSVTFFPQKIYHLWDKVEKYGRTRQATDDNKIRLMRVACWIRYKHTHTLTICNISFFFFTAAMFVRTRLTLTSHVHCLSYLTFIVKYFTYIPHFWHQLTTFSRRHESVMAPVVTPWHNGMGSFTTAFTPWRLSRAACQDSRCGIRCGY